MAFNSVLLPAPFGPTMPHRDVGSTRQSTLERICADPRDNDRFSTNTAAPLASPRVMDDGPLEAQSDDVLDDADTDSPFVVNESALLGIGLKAVAQHSMHAPSRATKTKRSWHCRRVNRRSATTIVVILVINCVRSFVMCLVETAGLDGCGRLCGVFFFFGFVFVFWVAFIGSM